MSVHHRLWQNYTDHSLSLAKHKVHSHYLSQLKKEQVNTPTSILAIKIQNTKKSLYMLQKDIKYLEEQNLRLEKLKDMMMQSGSVKTACDAKNLIMINAEYEKSKAKHDSLLKHMETLYRDIVDGRPVNEKIKETEDSLENLSKILGKLESDICYFNNK